MPSFQYIRAIPLHHQGDCRILGVSPALEIFVEEIYGEDDWLAVYHFTIDGKLLKSFDENIDQPNRQSSIQLPNNLLKNVPVSPKHPLNYKGARTRGLRAEDRIQDVVQSLSIAEKMQLLPRLSISVSPMALLGIAEIAVLAETPITSSETWVCLRLRIAYALAEVQYDANRLPYDYDTTLLHILYRYNQGDEFLPQNIITSLDDIEVQKPMDCFMANTYFFVAEGGTIEQNSQVHIWKSDSSE